MNARNKKGRVHVTLMIGGKHWISYQNITHLGLSILRAGPIFYKYNLMQTLDYNFQVEVTNW